MGYLPGPQEPEIHVIKLHKSNNGMGLSIVAAKVSLSIQYKIELDRWMIFLHICKWIFSTRKLISIEEE